MLRKTTAALGLAAAMAVSVTACTSSSSSSASTNGSTRELRIGLSFGPFNLDPAKDQAGLPNVMRSLTNESLFHLNADYTATPDLVSSYHYVGTGNKVFEFTLKPGIRFTDGEPLNAAAVKGWLDYFAKQPSPFATMLQTASITTQGQYTVRLNLAAPNPIVPVVLSQYGNHGAVSSPKAVNDPKLMTTQTYGVGPYMVDPNASVAGDHYTLVPSPYADKSKIHFSKVTVRIISNPNTMLQAFQAGQLDFGNLDPSVAAHAKPAGIKIMHWTSGTITVTLLDRNGTLVKPLRDVRVREALNYALDRKAITTAMVGQYGEPTSQLVADYTDPAQDNAYPYDVAKAKSLLAAAGYPHGFTISVVDAGGIVGNWGDPTMQVVAKYWQAIGVKTQIKQAPTDFTVQLLSKKYAAVQWAPDHAPTWVLNSLLYAQHASLNPFAVQSPELDALFHQAEALPITQGAAVWKQLNAKATELAYNVPIYKYQVPWAMNPKLTGVQEGSWIAFAGDLSWAS